MNVTKDNPAQQNFRWKTYLYGFLSGVIVSVSVILFAVVLLQERPVWVDFSTVEPSVYEGIRQTLVSDGYSEGADFRYFNGERLLQFRAEKRNVLHLILAEEGLIPVRELGFEILENADDSTSEYEMELRKLEAMKSELRRILRFYDAIDDVSLSVPFILADEEEEFEISRRASVVLKLTPGKTLTPAQVRSIYRLVAGAFHIEGYANITVTDSKMAPIPYPSNDER